VNEGLLDLDRKLSGSDPEEIKGQQGREQPTTHNMEKGSSSSSSSLTPTNVEQQPYTYQALTVSHSGAVYTLNEIRRQCKIHRILAHEETGHLKSYARDRLVRKWCKTNHIPFIEYNQTGVTRRLKNRDDFSKRFKVFLSSSSSSSQHQPNTSNNVSSMRRRLVTDLTLKHRCWNPLELSDFNEIPLEHRVDRSERQLGGEERALATLESFLTERGAGYASGISSPNSSWSTGSRLSPYLTWGHVSIRTVIFRLQEKQNVLRKQKNRGGTTICANPNWLRSLSAFSSRMHWRSHFIQKLETEPNMEKYDLCPAFQHLRRGEGDWNQSYYDAWASGNTGFPFVDACMRCLIRHGWLNFRMRAMLVSFATYNLWLDWKRIAPHLARLFLDYEPGIHYPQLQMQAGTTGINAMRVYNVTKQGHDQDPYGIFIRKYVPELTQVPNEYIHEPRKMPNRVQHKHNIFIGDCPSQSSFLMPKSAEVGIYPVPIVDEKEAAKVSKAKVAAVRNQQSTKKMAEKVYVKHGSRNKRSNEMNGSKAKALSSSKRIKLGDDSQQSIKKMFLDPSCEVYKQESFSKINANEKDLTIKDKYTIPGEKVDDKQGRTLGVSEGFKPNRERGHDKKSRLSWTCSACTFLNEKPFALACEVCGTEKSN
jgi:deoxyribodipyrimidine photo-lyase